MSFTEIIPRTPTFCLVPFPVAGSCQNQDTTRETGAFFIIDNNLEF